jgi:hypothetical protein
MAMTINTRRTRVPDVTPRGNDLVPQPRTRAADTPSGVAYTGTPVTGEPLQHPPMVRSMGGVLEHTLAGQQPLPSEVLRVRPGDRIRLRTDARSAAPGPGQHAYTVPTDWPAGLHWPHPHLSAVVVEGEQRFAQAGDRIGPAGKLAVHALEELIVHGVF